jgi:trehalose 6-phosphate phosphatase
VIEPSGSATVERGLAAALERVAAAPKLLVASDFDGTLAPLVDDPAKARALPEAEAALIALAAAPETEIALVSGRSLASLRAGVGQLADHATLVGGHGVEHDDDAPSSEETARLDTAMRVFDDFIDDVPGAWLERKPFSVVIHVRCVEPDEAEGLLQGAALLAQELELHVLEGHGVLEALVRHPAKGVVLDILRERVEADAVVYLGDDITDEDAFAALGPEDLGISIGPTPTGADFRVSSPRAAAQVLIVLASERARAVSEP